VDYHIAAPQRERGDAEVIGDDGDDGSVREQLEAVEVQSSELVGFFPEWQDWLPCDDWLALLAFEWLLWFEPEESKLELPSEVRSQSVVSDQLETAADAPIARKASFRLHFMWFCFELHSFD
jgi:hypothetical protein